MVLTESMVERPNKSDQQIRFIRNQLLNILKRLERDIISSKDHYVELIQEFNKSGTRSTQTLKINLKNKMHQKI